MDFVTITDHDTIDGALSLDHLPDTFVSEELTAALQGRAAGGARPLLRHHARRSRVAPGPQRRRRGRARRTCTSTTSPRARSPLLRRRGAAHRAPPAASRPAVPDLGDAQRLARQGAQPAGVRVHRDARGNRASEAPTTTPESTSAARSPRRLRAAHARRSSSPTSAPGAPRAHGAAGQRRQVGPRRDGAGDTVARPRRDGVGPPDPRAVLKIVERVMREGDVRHGCGRAPTSARGCARAAACVARRDGPRHRRERAARPLLQEGDLSHADLYRRARRDPRAHAGRRPCRERRGDGRSTRRTGLSAARAVAVRRVHAGDPVRRRRPPSSAARRSSWRAPTATGRASRSSPTGSAGCTASRTRSTRSATAASPASRSR